MKIICFFKGIFRTFKTFLLTSGHDYIDVYRNKDIHILKCRLCGHVSVGFSGETLSKIVEIWGDKK